MNTKTCSVCKEPRPLSDFLPASPSAPTKDGYKGRCRICTRAYHRRWEAKFREEHGISSVTRDRRKNPEEAQKKKAAKIQKLKEWVDELKLQPCLDCKGTFDPVCMDFDHVRGEKRRGIVQLVFDGAAKKTILDEIAKCDLVCANCHRIRTWKSGRDMPWYDKNRKYDRSDW